MDICARGVKAAAAMLEDGSLQENLISRYAGWEGELGGAIMDGEHDLESLAAKVIDEQINPQPVSGKQEILENIVNRFI
jgi:xylose isomerase